MIDPSPIIRRFKTAYEQDPMGCSLAAVTKDARIKLRPLQATADAISVSDVTLLTEWRNRNRQYFLSDFTATPERTLRWLTEICGPDLTRILFMIEAADGTPFGHVGLCKIDGARSYGEVDNVVRGREGAPGGMSAAVVALCEWAQGPLGLQQLWVRVMADNPAVRFYERLGFRFVRDTALTRRQSGPAEFRWEEREGPHPDPAHAGNPATLTTLAPPQAGKGK